MSDFNRFIPRNNKLRLALATPFALIALEACGDDLSATDELEKHAYAVCKGEQEFTAKPGDTLSELIEDHVQTDPEDKLTSAKSLHDIAAAYTRQGYDGHVSDPLYVVDTSMALDPMQLRKGETYVIPTSCERVAD